VVAGNFLTSDIKIAIFASAMDNKVPEAQKEEFVSSKKDDFHYWQYCVNCGTLLVGHRCKLICTKCGFYHSCSEP